MIKERVNQFDDVEILGRKNLSAWKEFKDSSFPLQPDIDMLLCKKDGDLKTVPLQGIEFKAFYIRDTGRTNWSYYAGLDEALALINYGLDYVTLFHCFIFDVYYIDTNNSDNNKQINNFSNYSNPMRNLIKKLKLPIGYIPSYTFSESGRIGINEKVEIIDNASSPDVCVITAKRLRMNRMSRSIRKEIIKKLEIDDNKLQISDPIIK